MSYTVNKSNSNHTGRSIRYSPNKAALTSSPAPRLAAVVLALLLLLVVVFEPSPADAYSYLHDVDDEMHTNATRRCNTTVTRFSGLFVYGELDSISADKSVMELPILKVLLTDDFGSPIRQSRVPVALIGTQPSTLHLVGPRQDYTDASGYAYFKLNVTNPRVGGYKLIFHACGNATTFYYFEIHNGNPARIEWGQKPLWVVRSGEFLPTPTIRLYDGQSNLLMVPSSGGTTYSVVSAYFMSTAGTYVTSTVCSGHTSLKCTDTPSGSATPSPDFPLDMLRIKATEYPTLNMYVSVTAVGHAFSVGPAEVKYTSCTTQGEIVGNHILPMYDTDRSIQIRRSFDYELRDSVTCRINKVMVQAQFIDVCNVRCPFAILRGPQRGKLQVSYDRTFFEDVGDAVVLGDAADVRVYTPTQLRALPKLSFTVTPYVVDAVGNALGPAYPNPKGNHALITSLGVSCSLRNGQRPMPPTGTLAPLLTVTSVFRAGHAPMNITLENIRPGMYEFQCSTMMHTLSSSVWVKTAKTFQFNITIREAPCPVDPRITAITGCTRSVSNGVVGCRTNGTSMVTIKGRELGYSGASIFLERTGAKCAVRHDFYDPTGTLYANCSGTGQNITMHVLLGTGQVARASTDQHLSFHEKPQISAIGGCPQTFDPSTFNCFNNGTSTVTIRGANFGLVGARVRFYYSEIGTTGFIECTTVKHHGDKEVTCTGFPGNGNNFRVGVLNHNGEETISSTVTMSFFELPVVPCPIVNDIYCAGHGDCDTTNGKCTCHAAADKGYWSGDSCTQCAGGRYGNACKGTCPGGASLPCGGAGKGTCSQGTTGTGVCTCDSGYAGTACELICPGGVSSPCSNKGTCETAGTCTCYADTSKGYWSGTACTTCLTGYVGSTCEQKCPVNSLGVVCSSHGTCSAGSSAAQCTCDNGYCGSACDMSGSSCGICPTGKYGTGCANTCPGFTGSTACNAHGTCSEGVQGTGLCRCNSGYAKDDCSIECPGGASNPCSGHGTCSVQSGVCTCQAGYAGSACSITCPGQSTGNTCSGHGSCFDGVSGNGTCGCRNGFWGTLCNNECPGSAQTPCTLHGTCSTTSGVCTCNSYDLGGFWKGAACTECQQDWWGPRCNGTCPKTNGLQCAGHGSCSHELLCKCVANNVQGFWQEPNCSTCVGGYFGEGCKKQCPGGSCAPCSNHGMCYDGVSGNGTCACYRDPSKGYWTGDRCQECIEGHWGVGCTGVCPIANNAVCGGHGTCSDGQRGTGTCNCQVSESTGFWGGSACGVCLSGYYGSECKKRCPGTAVLGPCSGHGSCADGSSGAGVCSCHKDYYGADCSLTCPTASGKVCGGHGTCLFNIKTMEAKCMCERSLSRGFWDGTACADCIPGMYGSSCVLHCPRGGYNSSAVCSGHGSCSDGVRGHGNCTCGQGYSGAKCSKQCRGGASNPCSGHGTCSQVDGECTCTHSTISGFWSGRNCSVCDPLYMSSRCTVACPTDNTQPCSGHGSCFEGLCFECSTGYCGSKCEKSGFDCQSTCPAGYYGSQCEFLCPGGGDCSGRGYCSEGKDGTGKCTCKSGAWGTSCSSDCPGGFSNPCSGHGTCSSDGTCKCDDGYATDSCRTACPGGASNPCNGHGTCDLAAATCTCTYGYAGTACEKVCHGGAANPCTGNGRCDTVTGHCTCSASAATGFWNGTRCDTCQSGHQGDECKGLCVNGQTKGRVCICYPHWSGAACDQPCPGLDQFGRGHVCSGHGNCTSGNHLATGLCSCSEDYYTKDCSVYCHRNLCKQSPHFLVNPQCNAKTGKCMCSESFKYGFYSDTTTQCTKCKLFYWGLNCEKECPCRKRGGCDQNSGACQCFDTDVDGHFDGTSCERCKTGFIGANCKGKDVAITRNSPASAIVKVKDRESFFLLADDRNGLLYGGGRPLLVFNLTTNVLLAKVEFAGTVISGDFQDNDFIRLTLGKLDNHPSPAANQALLIRRGLPPDKQISIASQGNIYFVRTSSSPSGTGRRLQAVHSYTQLSAVASLNDESRGETYTVMSNGAVSRIRGLEQVEDALYSQYFSQVTCATMTTSIMIDPPVMLIGGNNMQGEWQLIAVTLPTLATATVTDITALVRIPQCANRFCQSVSKVVVDGTFVAIALNTETGVGLSRFRYTQIGSSGLVVEYSTILDFVSKNTVVNVTALLLDPLSGAGFIAVNPENEPTTLYKFDLITLGVYGSVRFQRVGSAYEIVTSLYRDTSTRTLYASIPLELQHTVVPLNMYAVTRVFPELADTAGGTLVTIEGEGFVNDNTVCNFTGVYVTAQFINSRELRCLAPSGGDERCEGNPLEVSIGKERFSKNDVPLRRVTSPRISRVYTSGLKDTDQMDAYGAIGGGSTIVLEGFGFQNSTLMGCRIKSANKEDAQYARFADLEYVYYSGTQGNLLLQARFISSSRLECTQPAFPEPTLLPAYIEVTLDGTVFSRTNTPYEVVGPAVGIKAFHWQNNQYVAAVEHVLSSARTTTLPDLFVSVTDAVGHRLRKLDVASRPITVALAAYQRIAYFQQSNGTTSGAGYCNGAVYNDTYVANLQNATIAYTVDGVVKISGLYIENARSGTYTLEFIELTTKWTHHLNFTIETGNAAEIRICTQPSEIIDNNNPMLTTQPKLYAVDESGNQLPTAALNLLQVTAYWVMEYTQTLLLDGTDGTSKYGLEKVVNFHSEPRNKTASTQDNFFNFEGIEMKGLHGGQYRITFKVDNDATIPEIQSHTMTVKPCQNNVDFLKENPDAVMYFARNGTSECFVCPDNGLCDGSDKVSIREDGWWRASAESYQFYSCKPPYSGDSCLAPNGTCKLGYTGPRCSVCDEGYGRSGMYCNKCPNEASLALLLFTALMVGILFCAIIVFFSITAERRDVVAVVLKLFISHMQVSSRIADIGHRLPSSLALVFELQKKASEIARLDFAPLDCPPTRLTYYDRFFLLMSIPAAIMFLFACVFILVRIAQNVLGIQPKENKHFSIARSSKRYLGDAGVNERHDILESDAGSVKSNEDDKGGNKPQKEGVHGLLSQLTFGRMMGIYGASVVVIMFLVYPTVLQESMYLMQCEDIVSGDGQDYHVTSYFTQDRSIKCTDSSHKLISGFGLGLVFLYGIGTPIFAIIAVVLHWKVYRWHATRQLFSFFLAGYRQQTWWWECVVLLRKVAIVCCIVFISDPMLQVYVAMWCMAMALSLHVYFAPYKTRDFPMLHYLEGLSLSLITVTLNLILLYEFSAFHESSSQPTGYYVLTIGLMSLNGLMIVIFLYGFCLALSRRLRKKFCPRPSDDINPNADEFDDDDEADDNAIPTLKDAILSTSATAAAVQRRRSAGKGLMPGMEVFDDDGANNDKNNKDNDEKHDHLKENDVVGDGDESLARDDNDANNHENHSNAEHPHDDEEDDAAQELEARLEALRAEVDSLQIQLTQLSQEKSAAIDERFAIETLQIANCVAEIAREEALTEALEEQLAEERGDGEGGNDGDNNN